MKGLSVIIPSYNTKEMTLKCVTSLAKALKQSSVPHEIIVVDNDSRDGSPEAVRETNKAKVILNKENVGYGKANNQALKVASYGYVLFLNSDVLLDKGIDFNELIEYMETHEDIGVLTVQVDLADGTTDPASHRGFPTLWRSLCYFTGLEKLFGTVPYLNRIFGGYHLTHLDKKNIHEIDSPTGAFYLTRLSLMKELHGFDEDFFMYGEDLDLSYRIKEKGYKIIYYPYYHVTHYKSHSGLKSEHGKSQRSRTRGYFYGAMAIFYRKHYARMYPSFINGLVYSLIKMREKLV